MKTPELIMREQHPPHSYTCKKTGLSIPHIFLRIVVLTSLFILCYHFRHLDQGTQYPLPAPWDLTEGLLIPSPTPQSPNDAVQKKEQTIQEILRVLEKYPAGLANVAKKPIAEVIYDEATRYNQDPKFILALIATESSFQNRSVSGQGAKGLMQIMPHVAQSLAQEMGIEWSGDRTLFNPFLNIRMGVYYLSQLIVDFEDFSTALTAYNYGPTYVKGLIERKKQIPGDFYRKILDTYHSL